MSDIFQCGDNTALVGYLYGECEGGERSAIAAHVSICAACAAELAALDSAREQLAAWTPPDAVLGYAISRPRSSPIGRGALSDVEGQAPGISPQQAALRPAGAWGLSPGAFAALRHPVPAWAQAAAACLIFGAGLWLGVMRGTADVADVSAARTAAASAPVATNNDLAALERRLRAEMMQLRSAAVTSGAPVSPNDAGSSAAALGALSNVEGRLLARVRTLIEESEQRQQRQLALRTAQVVRDFDLQRQMDLAQIQNTVGQIEGLTGAEVRDQRQMLNYLMRVSEQR